MTREELREHCERQIKQFERAEKIMPVTPNDWKRYEEHKMVLELLEPEPCEDAISRAYLLEAYEDRFIELQKAHRTDTQSGVNWCINTLKDMPPVAPTREKGKWTIDDKEYGRIWKCHCSKCGKDPQIYIGGSENWWLVRLPKYCPTCGKEMESDG